MPFINATTQTEQHLFVLKALSKYAVIAPFCFGESNAVASSSAATSFPFGFRGCFLCGFQYFHNFLPLFEIGGPRQDSSPPSGGTAAGSEASPAAFGTDFGDGFRGGREPFGFGGTFGVGEQSLCHDDIQLGAEFLPEEHLRFDFDDEDEDQEGHSLLSYQFLCSYHFFLPPNAC